MNGRLESLLNLLKKEPEDSFLIYGIALEYISQKDYTKAEEYFKLLLQNDPKYVPAYMQYARLKENLNEIENAKNLYREGIKVAKEQKDLHAAKEMEEFLNELV